ncbi:MAG TPA: hypothetical protein DCX34_05930 [Roseovarius sp.]|nr:hypothetical protein [Roseovarius sp.]
MELIRKARSLSRTRTTSRRLRARRTCLPRQQYSNDFHLVEFPKSGITWLTVLLANMCLRNGGSSHRATFSSVRSYIPDLDATPDTLAHEFASPQVRFYKSHSSFEAEMAHVIYVVRHPLNVMRSYHRYMTGLDRYSDSLEAFCNHPDFGIEAWKRHVHSWFSTHVNFGNRFLHLVRYEDLLSDTTGELRALARNFGWYFEDDAITRAVDLSSRSEMREQEALARQRNPGYALEFVSAAAYEAAPRSVERRIERSCRDECALLGYES